VRSNQSVNWLVFLAIAILIALSPGAIAQAPSETPQPTSSPALRPSTELPPRPVPRTTADLEQSIYEQINQYRTTLDLPPLRLDEWLSEQAREHSQAMADRRIRVGHDGFDQRVQRIGREIRYRRIGENVAFNQGYIDPASRAVRGWLNSPSHRANIEDRYDLTGIGVVVSNRGEYFFTQIFVRRR
jgi:uncharacterized protein YkwD